MYYHQAVVTGASKGIGAAIAQALIEEGLRVYGIARDERALQTQREKLGENFVPIIQDVRNLAAIASAFGANEGGDFAIDVLVNNVGGLSSVRPLHEQTEQEISSDIELNLGIPLRLTRLLLPGMIKRRKGHIFNLTSTAASAVFPGTTAYGAAKAGLSQAGRILRYDLAGTGVRLTEIAPGRVETEFYLQAFEGDRDKLSERMYLHQQPLRPVDIAHTLLAALRLPLHVDVAEIIVSPREQAAGGYVYPTLAK